LDDHVILIENKIATKFFIGILWYTKYFFNIFYYASLKSLGNTNLDRQRDKIISRQNMTYTVKKLDRQTDRQTDKRNKRQNILVCQKTGCSRIIVVAGFAKTPRFLN
jgi:hypothetical protein